jgi:hypothetical protein
MENTAAEAGPDAGTLTADLVGSSKQQGPGDPGPPPRLSWEGGPGKAVYPKAGYTALPLPLVTGSTRLA